MAANDSFERAKAEKFAQIQQSLANITDTFGLPSDMNQRREAARKLCDACYGLSQIINSGDRPEWLQTLEASSRSFVSDPQGEYAKRLQRAIVTHSRNVKPIGDNESLAFDKYFEQLHEKETVSERFDRLAAELQKLIDEEEITDAGAIKVLEKMIATLKANRRASFWSTAVAMSVVKNGWVVVAAMATFANQTTAAIKNVKDLIDDTASKVEDMQSAINEKAISEIKCVSKRVSGIAEEKLKRLPAPSQNGEREEGDEPIDVEYTTTK